MRHLNAINSLGRKSADRKAMMANLASSLILHKRISTTTAKARALRTYVEPLITRSKDDSTHSRRVVFSYLGNKNAVAELFREVAPKIASRPGGYTRILKTGSRIGDAAEMCIIELVDFNENMLAAGEGTKAKASRRRRGSRKKSAEVAPAAETAVTEAATETIVAEAPAEAAAATETTAEVAATEAETPAEETGAETEDSKE
ncbi:MAG: 50S ribosomal protein L17 [Bacteroidales bacterium]